MKNNGQMKERHLQKHYQIDLKICIRKYILMTDNENKTEILKRFYTNIAMGTDVSWKKGQKRLTGGY